MKQLPPSIATIFAISAFALTGCHSLLDRPRQAAGVRLQDVTFHSAALNRDMPYRVYLPANVAAGQRLPVIFLLHGSGGSYLDWSNDSDIAGYAARGLILVMPEGNSSYYMNAAQKRADRFEDYFTTDLIADVESRFPAARGRDSRAIVGVSMGGFAAVKLALTRPDLFVFAGGISPAIDVPSRHFTFRRWQQGMRFRSIFGPEGSESRRNSDPFFLVQRADPTQSPYLYLTAGDREPLLGPIQRFVADLKERHFRYEFHTKAGGHDWSQWNEQVPGCFESLLVHLRSSAR